MRIASVRHDGVVRVGVVEGDGVHLLDRPVTVLDLLRLGDLTAAGRDALRSRPVALRDVRLLAPLEPPVLRGVFFNGRVSRRDHVVVFVVRAFRQEGKPRHPAEIVDYGFFARDALPPDTTRGTRARLAELFDAAAISPRW